MKRQTQLALMAVLLCLTMACGKDSAPSSSREVLSASNENETASVDANEFNEVAVIQTVHGEMVLEFWPDVAPNTVQNFKKLAKEGFYDGTAFHRVRKGFMIQGGDPLTKDPAKRMKWGTGDPGYRIKAEFSSAKHVRGVLSMAREPDDPDSAGSQFYICLAPAPQLDHQYTAFGKLISGDDVLTKIGSTPVGIRPGGGEISLPNKRMHVDSIKIVQRESAE